MKKRLDQILVDNGLVESRTKAQAIIMAGQVYAHGQIVDKSGTKLDENTDICVKSLFPYVSRGALKLEKAHQEFGINFVDKVLCDIGSSTGGFTDYALQHGAKKVFAVDVGTGQLAQKIREDTRVVVMEKTDFRNVESFPDNIDIFVCDVSFISLKKIIPKVVELISSYQFSSAVISTDSSIVALAKLEVEKSSCSLGGRSLDDARDDRIAVDIILLIKPQFEAGVKEVSKGKGVIRDEVLRQEIVEDIKLFAQSNGFTIGGIVESPITGAKGNVEYLLYLKG